MKVRTQLTNNENRKRINVKLLSISCVVFALMLVVASFALAVKPDKPHKPPKDGGGERTAQVTITGPMQTDGTQTFPIKDSEQTLILNRGVWTEWGAVPISYAFEKTVAGVCQGDDLMGHLVDSVPDKELIEFPYRWQVVIHVDISSLDGVDSESTTNSKGGHSIDIWTDPDDYRASTPTITDTPERLWIPEGPNKSGLVTVKWVLDDTDDSGTRTRVFEFTSEQLQVVSYPSGSQKKDKPRKWMRCLNLDDPIVVEVVTTP